METIAVYWEPVIKTYGIIARTGLRMISTTVAVKGESQADLPMESFARGYGEQVLILARPDRDGCLRVHLVVSDAGTVNGGPPQGRACCMEQAGTVTQTAVDLIFLQGPHYGDRYGILETAFGALLSAGIPLLAASCCGSCIYLVLPPGVTRTARDALSAVFVVPGFEKSRKNR